MLRFKNPKYLSECVDGGSLNFLFFRTSESVFFSEISVILHHFVLFQLCLYILALYYSVSL